MALSTSDTKLIGELVVRLREEHSEREAAAVERLMQQVGSPDSTAALAGYMTTGEAAGLIGVSLQTIKNWARQGRLVGNRVGGRTLVTRASVQAFFDSLGTAADPVEDKDVGGAEAADHEVMENLPAGLADRVEALLERQRAGQELSAVERKELRELAHAGTDAATRRAHALIPGRSPRA